MRAHLLLPKMRKRAAPLSSWARGELSLGGLFAFPLRVPCVARAQNSPNISGDPLIVSSAG